MEPKIKFCPQCDKKVDIETVKCDCGYEFIPPDKEPEKTDKPHKKKV